MHIGVIGGVESNVLHYADVALSLGHSFEYHAGKTAGRGAVSLENLVERADLLIVITDVNSHNAVLTARRLARERGTDLVLVRRFGVASFRRLLEERARAAVAPAERGRGAAAQKEGGRPALAQIA